ncbi:MAG: hypothetical protein M1818_004558 [Claussenomyces sp. TS43310]|nr:MAG: hypothetical protein M1818_004558 [Claussenomyces sp. TS43310]
MSAEVTHPAVSELEHIRRVWHGMQGNSPIYDFLLSDQDFSIESASKGNFRARLTLSANHVNSRKTIHGGVTATLVDFAGGLAIATHGMEKTGASVDIHVTYIGTAGIGDIVEIEGIANKVGRSMAFTTVKITKIVEGKPGGLVASASHTKFLIQPRVGQSQ